MKAVEIRNLTVKFGQFVALDGISLEIEEGQIYGLLGPNGAGKTTIIRSISTLINPESGNISVFGTDVASNPNLIRKQIGLAGQYAAVDEALTGMQNLEMIGRLYHLPRALVKKRSIEMLERLGLSDAASRRVKTYSGGMRRRLDLGASLIGHAKLILLDEPTTGLDPRTRNELWMLIREIVSEGSTILLTTQYLEEADALADMIAIIDKGKKVAEGTATDLKNKLGSNVLSFSTDAPLDVVHKLVKSSTYDEATNSWKVKLGKNGVAELLALAQKFDSAGIELTNLSIHQPTLDDVFLKLTGHNTEETAIKKPIKKRRRQ